MSKKKNDLFLIVAIIFCIILSAFFYITIHNFGTHASTDSTLSIDDEYFLNRTSAHSVNLTNTEGFVIRPIIEEFNYDGKFVIARTTNDTKSNYYWIIDRTENSIYGPMNEEGFTSKKNELAVKLKLKKVSKFFK